MNAPQVKFHLSCKNIDIWHNDIWKKKSSNTFEGREMVVVITGVQCPKSADAAIVTDELSLKVAMELIKDQKELMVERKVADLYPEFVMESINRNWLQVYIQSHLAKAIKKLTAVYNEEPFNLEFKFQYFRKKANKESEFIFDRTAVVKTYLGDFMSRVNCRLLADESSKTRYYSENDNAN